MEEKYHALLCIGNYDCLASKPRPGENIKQSPKIQVLGAANVDVMTLFRFLQKYSVQSSRGEDIQQMR